MRANNFLMAFLTMFFLVGCRNAHVPKSRDLDEVRFEIDDRRNTPKGNVCAVSFKSESRFVSLPSQVFVKPRGPDEISAVDVLLSAFLPRTWTTGGLGSVYCVRQATERFAELEDLCQKGENKGVESVSVTFYGENAFPHTYLIEREFYSRVIDSWQIQRCSRMDQDEKINLARKRFPLREDTFKGLESIVRSGQFELVVVFVDDDLTAVAYTTGALCCGSGFFRLFGWLFQKSEDTVDCFLEKLREKLQSPESETMFFRVVIW